MRYKMITSLALVMILALGGLAWAHDHDDMMMGRHYKGMRNGPMWFLKKLDLTKKQQEKVDKIIEQHKSERKALREKIRTSGKNLFAAIHADTFNEQNIRAASQVLAVNMADMAVLKGKTFSEIRSILTPEQIAKMKEMQTRFQERMKHREKCREHHQE